jgi:hypothetical protein
LRVPQTPRGGLPPGTAVQAYEGPEEICQRENRLMLFLELEMRFVRLDMLWQTLSSLIT